MKRSIVAFLILGILMSAGCKKTATVTHTDIGGAWTFYNQTFPATSCITSTTNVSLAATDSFTGNPDCQVVVYFYNNLPAASGTFNVVGQSTLTVANQAYITVGYSAPSVLSYYGSTGGNGTQKVNVTVSNGKISISCSAIEMVNLNAADSTTLAFNIMQTQ